MIANSNQPPHPEGAEYHAPITTDVVMSDIYTQYKQIGGDVRYIADSKRPGPSYLISWLGESMQKPTKRHFSIIKSTLQYLTKKRNYGI